MTEPIVRTEPLGGSPLARAAIDGQRGEWYPDIPRSEQAWTDRVEAVRASSTREWLETIRSALSASGTAAARLARVASGRGVVVTTGQQPGLFGGPIYTWSKALSALTLADEIEAATGIPAAPVFWAANDDADFAEASWTAVAVTGGAERLTVAAGAPLGRTMADMPLGDVAPAFAALLRACGATLDPRPIDAVRAAYRDGATVGGAYLSLLRALFEPLGIAVLDAAHASVAEAARPFLLRALDRANAVAEALRERDEAILAAGFSPQVAEVAGLSLVFERARDRGDKRRIPLSEAAAVAAQGDSARPGRTSDPADCCVRRRPGRALVFRAGERGRAHPWSRRATRGAALVDHDSRASRSPHPVGSRPRGGRAGGATSGGGTISQSGDVASAHPCARRSSPGGRPSVRRRVECSRGK